MTDDDLPVLDVGDHVADRDAEDEDAWLSAETPVEVKQ